MPPSRTKSNSFEPKCHVCQLPANKREWVDAELLDPRSRVAAVADAVGVSTRSLYHHRRRHIDAALVAAAEDAFEMRLGRYVLDRLCQLLNDADSILGRIDATDTRDRLAAIETSRRVLADLARIHERNSTLLASLGGPPTEGLDEVAAVLLGALTEFPEARAIVAAALEGVEA